MNDISEDIDARVDPLAHIALTPTRDIVRKEPRKIEVPEGKELNLCPSDRELAGDFFRTRIQSYADLQVLGFVPRKLAEGKVRQAMADDDKDVFNIALSGPRPTRRCSCSDGSRNSHIGDQALPMTLRQAYTATRATCNPALARLLSDHLGTSVEWDTPAVGLIRKWTLFAKFKPVIVGLLLKDIIIHRNATLKISAASRVLLAHDIFIHRTGTLFQQGGYLKIWANSIGRLSDFSLSESIAKVRKTTAGWLLND